MHDLVERVTAALGSADDSPWLPELAAELAESGWADLYHDTGIGSSEYGTARVMARSRSAPRKIVSVIPAALSDGNSVTQVLQIEVLGQDTARPYEESGIRFFSEDEINEERLAERIVEAVNILKGVPTLFMAVAALVRSVHLIDAGDEDYDVSFSEPYIPFSIFVSVPRVGGAISALRVAEAIVHEAMHLQLTLIEQIVPLVSMLNSQHYSPWRGEFRNAQGVLHGLYVFYIIDVFFRALQSLSLHESDVIDYIKRRRSEIRSQLGSIRSLQDSEDLTPIGGVFIRRMMAGLE